MIKSPKQIQEKIKHLKGERGTWETHWQECMDYILPRKNNVIESRVKGEKVNQFLLDNTALQSNVLLSGFLHGLLTNPNSQWFELITDDKVLNEDDEVRLWLQDTSDIILHSLNNSNFQTEIHEVYIDLGAIGTACMSIEEDDQTDIRFSARHIKGVFIDENHKGEITEVFREFRWNARQIVNEFGEEVLAKSRSLQKAFEKDDPREFCLFHAVYPKEVHPQIQGAKPWISQYVLEDGLVELRSSGFREFPYVVPRWTKNTGEKYGRSPGMNALPEAKTLNMMVETTIKGAQKVVDPPLQAPDDGFLSSIRTRPGAVNFYRAGSQDRIVPIFNDARVDFGFQAIEEKRARIRESFFVDQLRLRDGTPQMTATEVEARIEQAFRFMGPVLGRQQSELLRPLIDRVFEILQRKGKIPQAPAALEGRVIDVQYSSMIARSQRQGEAKAILRTVEQATPFISANPALLDLIDGEKALRSLARLNNFPQDILRSDQEVKKIREQRAEQEVAVQEQEAAAQTAENIGKAGPALASIANTGGLGV